MDSKELKDILQVLKDFNVDQVKLKMADFEIDCVFTRERETSKTKRSNGTTSSSLSTNSLFPEANYARSIMSKEITEEELATLNLAGVNPAAKLTNENIAERVVTNLKKHKVS